MGIDFLPSVGVAASLIAGAGLPIVLITLSHGPLKVSAPGQRFVAAAVSAWLTWVVALFALSPGWVDVASGTLLLTTATLAGFTLWTLIAWGFTLSMLLALNRAGRALSVEEWALAYTRGRPLAAFGRDRLGVLFALGLAEVRGGVIVMTPVRGRLLARLVRLLRKLFGLPK